MFKDPATMVAIFQALIHVVLVAAVFGKLVLIYAVVAKFSPSWQERIMRSIAAVSGLLVYLGAKALGLSLPSFLLQALTQSGSYLTGLMGALFPAMLGFIVAWYVTRYFNSRDARKNLIGMRLLAMVMTMVFFLYTDCYVATVDAAHTEQFQLLLPNLTFVLAILLYAVFRYHPLPDVADAASAKAAG
jgi:hypothetical protein